MSLRSAEENFGAGVSAGDTSRSGVCYLVFVVVVVWFVCFVYETGSHSVALTGVALSTTLKRKIKTI